MARRLASVSPSSPAYRPLSQGDHDDRPGRLGPGHGEAPSGPRRLRRCSVSPADDARVLRRIDVALLPLMLVVYFLQALDKATLSYASIFGLVDDTHLVGSQFAWLGSIVFLAQLVVQLPISLALVKLPIGKFTSAMVLAWGLALALMAFARDFVRLMVARFFLGAFEAGIGPSFIAITAMYWTRREQTMRIGSWYCMNGLTWVFGSLITYGLASIESRMRPYQIIFLFFGIVTVAVAFLMFYWMPDSPMNARFLSDDDKMLVIRRLRHNQTAFTSHCWSRSHFCEALRDPKTWLWFALIFCTSIPSNGISTFGPLIIKSFVSDPFHTILFNIPIGISHVIAVSASAYLSMKWKLKGPVIFALCIPPIIGLSVLLSFPHDASHRDVLLAAYFCLSTFTGITPLIYSWSSQNTAGDTKRKTTSAIVFIGASAGNIVGPLLFQPSAYSIGLRANIGSFAAVMALVVVTSLHLRWLNRKQGQRRVFMGKKATIPDLSLETAAGARMIEELERAARSDDGTNSLLSDDNEGLYPDDNQDLLNGHVGKVVLDATDLENEDFLFVY